MTDRRDQVERFLAFVRRALSQHLPGTDRYHALTVEEERLLDELGGLTFTDDTPDDFGRIYNRRRII